MHTLVNVACLLAAATVLGSLSASAQEPRGTLELSIVDSETLQPVPARVEVEASGAFHVASDALRFGGDCDMSDEGAGYTTLAAAQAGLKDRLSNPYSSSTQFYSTGQSTLSLPPGDATVTVFRGPEYRVAATPIEIKAGETRRREVRLVRWIDMPAKGWYSGDDHIHIPRPSSELNPQISKMMQAEDVHVANLLQMGKVVNFEIAPQYAHGPEGHYQEGHYILAAGQENPRTHYLGHTITLGAAKTHFDAERYLIYRLIWQETIKEGAINGFAHAYAPHGSFLAPHDGMAVVAPHDLLHFMEVLQFNRGGYEAWYDLLGLGFRITPTAGTDYPCAGQSLPGHERFYTRVDGPLTYAKWIDAVRKGRTFVTTGPMLEFRINGQDIGSEIILETPGTVELTGTAQFDPERDDLAVIELIQNGEIVNRFPRIGTADKIEFKVVRDVSETSWFAVRGYGSRIGEDVIFSTEPIQFASFKATTNVHGAPIYVTLRGEPGLPKSDRGKQIARAYLARLDALEEALAPDNIDSLARRLQEPNLDQIPTQTLRGNREALLQEIAVAKKYFKDLAN